MRCAYFFSTFSVVYACMAVVRRILLAIVLLLRRCLSLAGRSRSLSARASQHSTINFLTIFCLHEKSEHI